MIDKIILKNSTRGMDKLYAYYKIPFCKNASESFYLLNRGYVFIYTGFWANGMSETDGPVGAYFLYRALNIIGFEPIIITDEYCNGFFPDCKCLHVRDDSKDNLSNILASYNPVAHIAIERLGRDIDGFYKNSSGRDIGIYTKKLDILFDLATTPTYAIGDGGNEIGMGNFADFLSDCLHVNPTCVKCDYPIVSSVSNWGAYGFIAYLQKFSQAKLLPTFDEVKWFLSHIVKCGATDGFSGENIMSVDSKGYKIDKEILTELTKCI